MQLKEYTRNQARHQYIFLLIELLVRLMLHHFKIKRHKRGWKIQVLYCTMSWKKMKLSVYFCFGSGSNKTYLGGYHCQFWTSQRVWFVLWLVKLTIITVVTVLHHNQFWTSQWVWFVLWLVRLTIITVVTVLHHNQFWTSQWVWFVLWLGRLTIMTVVTVLHHNQFWTSQWVWFVLWFVRLTFITVVTVLHHNQLLWPFHRIKWNQNYHILHVFASAIVFCSISYLTIDLIHLL